jgi:hypothetical protein
MHLTVFDLLSGDIARTPKTLFKARRICLGSFNTRPLIKNAKKEKGYGNGDRQKVGSGMWSGKDTNVKV